MRAASGHRGAMRFLLGIQRKGPIAQPGQGYRFGIRFEMALGSEHPRPKRFPGRSRGRQLCPRSAPAQTPSAGGQDQHAPKLNGISGGGRDTSLSQAGRPCSLHRNINSTRELKSVSI